MITNPKRRFAAICQICRGIKTCRRESEKKRPGGPSQVYPHGGCGKTQPLNYMVKDHLKLEVEFAEEPEGGGDTKRELTAEEVLKILRNIDDKDYEIMGFDPARSRPDWMIIQNLPVPPPAVRPSISMDNTMKQDDDLTYQYRQIVKANYEFNKGGHGKPAHSTQDILDAMQYYCATLFDNDMPGVKKAQHRSGKALKAIRARLKGKEGRLRQNLMGKRVDFSARSVITPDPSLSLDQLGVPRTIAMNMTIPEVVNPMNFDRLRRLVENGPKIWPGANYIVRDNGIRVSLRDKQKQTDVLLEKGYTVERHLMDDDFVIFNRQPSLHKMSMMGHRVKVLPYSSFRLNLSVTTPYNADFDGDEMNMHVPQSYETKAEVKEIMHVPRQIVSPQSNKPVMGLVQDTLMGMRLITSKDTFIEKDILMNLLLSIENFTGRIPTPAILKPKPLWTGKQLISLYLPPEINLERTSSSHDTKFPYDTPINAMDTRVLIQKGQLLMGGLCKKNVGNAAGGLVHIIWSDFGPDACRRFLSTSQLLVNSWLVYHGFTVGIQDTISDLETTNKIKDILDGAMSKAREAMDSAQKGTLECQPGKNILETLETNINAILNDACSSAGKQAMSTLSDTNNFKTMVMSGSKGSNINISQIMSCVGQQNVEGKRIPFGFNRRTLPHFSKDDYGTQSRGFVTNSYLSGLTPQEFYFHAMGGREGLIDTAVKTSETGYIQRKLIKSLEDVMVKYDGTVRNSMGHILQFLYGEDGMAGEYIEDQTISLFSKNDRDMKNRYQLIDPTKNVIDEIAKLKEVLDANVVQEIADSIEKRAMITKNFEEMMKFRSELRYEILKNNDDKLHLPVNLERLIVTAKRRHNIENAKLTDLSPCTIIERTDELIKNLLVVRGDDRVSIEAQKNAIKLFTIHLKTELAPKKLIYVDKLTNAAFNWLIGEIDKRFTQAIVSPGEVVGAIAAQSMGEPATQMTLNTFHFAGVSSKNVTLGVPRLKEVINVAKTIKTPFLTIYTVPEVAFDKTLTKKIQAQLEYTTLSQVASSVQILYDPNPRDSIIVEDNGFLDLFYSMEDETAVEKVSPWVIRIVLSPEKIIDKDLRLNDIQRTIKEGYKGTVEVTCSDDNAAKLVIRVRAYKKEEESTQQQDQYAYLNQLKGYQYSIMNELPIKGILGIKKVYMREVPKPTYNDRGELKEDRKEWVMETDGVNLKETLNHPGVDHKRTYSNDIVEIEKVLGIEAVRQAIIKELRTVLSNYSIYVNYRHVALLADLMTHHGKLTSITRHGINRVDSAPLKRCSFEETVEILLEAAAFAEVDHIKGVTENIVIGQLCPLGTGSFDVLIDMDSLDQAKHINDMNEVIHGDDEEGMMTPMEDPGIYPQADTPFMGTPNYAGGKTPGTPGTPSGLAGVQFSPSYAMNIASPTYMASPAYMPGSDYQKPAEKYCPASPPREGSPIYQQVSSPGYSPEHSEVGSCSPGGGYSPGAGAGYSPGQSRVGVSMLNARARGSHMSPLYSPSGTFFLI